MSNTEKEITNKRSEMYKKWYGDNSTEYNEKRRSRYATDPEYREMVKERARNAKRLKIKSMGGAIERTWKGSKILVYRVGTACEKAGCVKAVLLDWENRGIVPPPVFGGKHRVYTQRQIDLIRELYDEVITAEGNYKEVAMIESTRRLYIKSQWSEGL